MTKDEALKLALEALDGLIKKTSSQSIYSFMETERRIAMSACVGIREALAHPAQEPMACIGTNGELMWLNKPRAIYSKPIPLYIAPPQRTWVGLTDEERKECIDWAISLDSTTYSKDLSKMIEYKLKEKNT